MNWITIASFETLCPLPLKTCNGNASIYESINYDAAQKHVHKPVMIRRTLDIISRAITGVILAYIIHTSL